MKSFFSSLFILALGFTATAQENLTYQKPPKEILELVDIERAPSVSMDSKNQHMVFMYRAAYKTLADLSEEEMKLGGLRINPKTNISSTVTYVNNLKYKKLKDKDAVQVKGLPQNAKLTNFSWSPDETKMAFTNTTATGVEVWVLDIATLEAKKLTDAKVNANMGNAISWFKDSKALLVKMLPANKPQLINTAQAIPTGPTVTVSDGTKAQNRTYQDLLKNKNDEDNFETLTTSELYKVTLTGSSSLWKEKAMYSSVSFSPDGKYLMVTTLHKPFSYIVTLDRFPQKNTLYEEGGKLVTVFNEKPLIEDMPQGFMAVSKGKRSITWRADKPATLVWAEALDNGDPAVEVPFRDEVFEVAAPFTGTPKSLAKTINRYSGITWGDDNTALLGDYWWNTRNTKTYIINPSNPSQKPEVIFDRNYQDNYSDPGNFDTKVSFYR